MTTPTREFDPASVIDQILTGHLPDPGQLPERDELYAAEADFAETIATWCANQDLAVVVEAHDQIPDSILEDLARLGAFRITIPERYGGLGFSDTCLLAVLSVLTAEHATLCEIVAAHQVIGAVRPLLAFGTETQRERYLPELIEHPSAFALNEPDLGYGGGPLQTTARLDPAHDGYRVTGTKTWITNATIATHTIVLADLEPTEQTPGGSTAVLINVDDPGVTRGPQSTFAGMHGLPNGRLQFENTWVPADRIIGGEGNGVNVALTCLSQCRAALPVACLTTTTACLRQASAWAREDRQTRRGLHTHPQIQAHLATLMVEALIANAVTWCALAPGCAPTDIETAKLIVSEAANRATDTTLQLVGGRGYETAASARRRQATPWNIEQLWRDTRVTRIFDSSTEMLKDLLAQPLTDTPAPPKSATDPETAQTHTSAAQTARLYDALSRNPEDPVLRGVAVDCALDLFTLHCLERYRQHLGEDDEPSTTAWQVTALDLHRRIDDHLRNLSDPALLNRRGALAAELVGAPETPASPFTHVLTALGARR